MLNLDGWVMHVQKMITPGLASMLEICHVAYRLGSDDFRFGDQPAQMFAPEYDWQLVPQYLRV